MLRAAASQLIQRRAIASHLIQQHAIADVCGTILALNMEYRRRLAACNFQRPPSALSLYRSSVRNRGAKIVADALQKAKEPVHSLLVATEAKHWRALHIQKSYTIGPLSSLDQVIVWLCRDALQLPLHIGSVVRGMQIPPRQIMMSRKLVYSFDYFGAIRAAAKT